MSFRFFAVPAHVLLNAPAPLLSVDCLAPEVPLHFEEVEGALSGAEFRNSRARDRVRDLLEGPSVPIEFAGGGPAGKSSAVFARPPDDLPAMLRFADQLEALAQYDSGERAMVWACQCGTRYAVPVALVRNVSIKCERCDRLVELLPSRSLGEEGLIDAPQSAVNSRRRKLASFFREAMARGWPVLVSSTQE